MIRGVLFDAGGVLTRPVGGRWNPRHDFESVVMRHRPDVDAGRFPEAIAAGQRFLDAGDRTADRADYHRVLLGVLGVSASKDLLTELEAPASGPVLELYPDARPALERLHAAGIRMSVVSDNWAAGFDETFRELGIARFFAGYVISELMGCTKPDPRMYAAGRDLIGLEAHECLFIDDDPALVAAAVDLGHDGVALIRAGERPTAVESITTLDALPARCTR
ncbi:HAD-IA family hydrolase [Actinoplanes sp. NPDC051470]|uniref:HAD family hydrolase n=1 Tax=unclassified Actinoplanes TaxID=2626549 RepID=UPI0034141856